MSAQARTLDEGTWCDDWSSCDPYLVLKRNGWRVLRTREHSGVDTDYFGDKVFLNNIGKYDRITIEMWDSDVGYSADDLMMRVDTNVNWLLNNRMIHSRDYYNYIEIEVKWTPRIPN